MNIGVIGIGGVGGYFGGKLTRLPEQDQNIKVYFIARGQHLNEIKKHGLILDTDEGEFICKPTYATDNIEELPALDLCLICVKGYDLDNILIPLKEKVISNTMILPLLNGVDIYERIRKRIKNGIVFPSCVYIGTHIEKYGKVTQRGGTRTIHFGNDPENKNFDPVIFDLFDKSGIKYNWLDNPYTEIWSKFLLISPFGLLTANFNKTFGEILLSQELSEYAKSIMTEIVQISNAKGIKLPASIVTDTFEKVKNFPYETRTSFQRDFENVNKPDERDLFGGAVIRMGEEFGIPTDTTRKIYESIQKKKNV